MSYIATEVPRALAVGGGGRHRECQMARAAERSTNSTTTPSGSLLWLVRRIMSLFIASRGGMGYSTPAALSRRYISSISSTTSAKCLIPTSVRGSAVTGVRTSPAGLTISSCAPPLHSMKAISPPSGHLPADDQPEADEVAVEMQRLVHVAARELDVFKS